MSLFDDNRCALAHIEYTQRLAKVLTPWCECSRSRHYYGTFLSYIS